MKAISVIRNISNMNYTSEAILIKRIDPRAKLPAPAHEDDVGYDLYPLDDLVLPSGKTTVCSTGITVAEPPGCLVIEDKIRATYFMKIEGRSGLASQGVFPVGGIIDPGYRGEIKVVLFNSTDTEYIISKTRAMAQIVIYHTETTSLPHKVVRFLDVDLTSSSTRGQDGFGSTDQQNCSVK